MVLTHQAPYVRSLEWELEASRVTLEASRVTLEASRVKLEASRVTLEASRVTLEASRVTLEASRVTQTPGYQVKPSVVTAKYYLSHMPRVLKLDVVKH